MYTTYEKHKKRQSNREYQHMKKLISNEPINNSFITNDIILNSVLIIGVSIGAYYILKKHNKANIDYYNYIKYGY